MTKTEFAAEIAWLEAATGKPICDGTGQERMARMVVYFEMLGDLPLPALKVAARQVVLEPLYNQFPPIHLLRNYAAKAMAGPDASIIAADAWAMALEITPAMQHENIVQLIAGSPHSDGLRRDPAWKDKILAELPAVVAETIKAFGYNSLHEDSTCRAQFMKMFDAIAAKRHQAIMMPATVRALLAEIPRQFVGQDDPKALPAPNWNAPAIAIEKVGSVPR